MKLSIVMPASNEIATIAESIRQGNGSGGGSSSNWWGPDEGSLLVHGEALQLGHREVLHKCDTMLVEDNPEALGKDGDGSGGSHRSA